MQEIKVKQFLELLENSDRLRIKDSAGNDLFVGWVAMHPEEFDEFTVKRFRVSPEFRVKDWKERGLAAPIEPDKAPDYQFHDLDLKLYYTIIL